MHAERTETFINLLAAAVHELCSLDAHKHVEVTTLPPGNFHIALYKNQTHVCLHVWYVLTVATSCWWKPNPRSCLFAKLWNSTRQGSAIKINMEVHRANSSCKVGPATPPKCNRKNWKIIRKKCHKFELQARNQLNWQTVRTEADCFGKP